MLYVFFHPEFKGFCRIVSYNWLRNCHSKQKLRSAPRSKSSEKIAIDSGMIDEEIKTISENLYGFLKLVLNERTLSTFYHIGCATIQTQTAPASHKIGIKK